MRRHLLLLSLSLILVTGCNQQRGNEPKNTADNNTSSRIDTNNEAKTSTGGPVSTSDQQFVTEAANGGMKEVELSTYVAQQTKNQDVKQLAERIAQDHTNANQELKTAAQQDNAQMPASIDEKSVQELNQFKKMSGSKLDRMYVQHMIEDHQKDIAKFQQQANSGMSAQVKAFAQKTLPTLQEHLQMAQQTQSKLR
jgi:putative membrane protein